MLRARCSFVESDDEPLRYISSTHVRAIIEVETIGGCEQGFFLLVCVFIILGSSWPHGTQSRYSAVVHLITQVSVWPNLVRGCRLRVQLNSEDIMSQGGNSRGSCCGSTECVHGSTISKFGIGNSSIIYTDERISSGFYLPPRSMTWPRRIYFGEQEPRI